MNALSIIGFGFLLSALASIVYMAFNLELFSKAFIVNADFIAWVLISATSFTWWAVYYLYPILEMPVKALP